MVSEQHGRHWRRLAIRLAAVLAGLGILFVLGSAARLPGNASRFSIPDAAAFDSGWTYQAHGRTIPVSGETWVRRGQARLTIANTLPADLPDDSWMYFSSHYQNITVCVDGAEVYRYTAWEEPAQFSPLRGNAGCLAALPPDAAGREITVTLSGQRGYHNQYVPRFRLATYETLLFSILIDHAGLILFLLVTTLLGIGALIAFFTLHGKMYLHISLMILCCNLWLLTDSQLPQFFTSNSLLITNLSFYAFMLLPLPFLLIVDEIGMGRRTLRALMCTYLINCAVQSCLYLTRTLDFMHMLPVTHGLIAVTMLYLIILLARACRRNRSALVHGIAAAEVVLMISAVGALIEFYRPNGLYYAAVLRCGALAFLIILLVTALVRTRARLEEQKQAHLYKSLAYLDSLTGLGSRTAFDMRMKSLPQETGSYERVTFVMCDLDALKQTNDTRGHRAGDRLICGAAACIRATCRQVGDCYRIGGDEFALIIPNKQLTEDGYRTLLQHELDDYNRTHTEQVSVSVGLAAATLPLPAGQTFEDLMAQADARMYADKLHTRAGVLQ